MSVAQRAIVQHETASHEVVAKTARSSQTVSVPLDSAADAAAGIRRGPFGPKAARESHLKVVDITQRTALQSRRRTILTVTSLTMACFVLFLGLAGFQAVLVQHQRQLDDVDKQLKIELVRNEQLNLEAQLLQRPKHVIAEANTQGMIEPNGYQYIQPPADIVAAFDGVDPAASVLRPVVQDPVSQSNTTVRASVP